MLGNFALCSRLLVFVPICAAVMLFIMCSDAARASHTVMYNVLRQLYPPFSQHHPSSIGLLSTETGLQTGTNYETETSGNPKGTQSIIDQQSKPSQFKQGLFSDGQNRQSQARITKVQRDHSADGVRPASSTFTSRSLQHRGQSLERWQSRENDHMLSQKEAPTGDSYNSHSVIIRKPSPEKAGSLQSSTFSQIWDHKFIPKSYSGGKVAESDSSKTDEDKSVRKSFYFSLSPSQTGDYWNTPRGRYSGYKETNEPPAVGAQSTSSWSQLSNFFSSGSHMVPVATSISNNLNAPVIERNLSVEKLTSSLTNFPHVRDSMSSSETLRHKKVQSYLFKDSQTSVNKVTGDGREALSKLSNIATVSNKQRPSGAQVYSRFGSNFNNVKDPSKQPDANLPYHHTNVAQYGGQMHRGLNKYQPITGLHLPPHITAQSSTQLSLHPASVKGQNRESFAPAPHVHSRDGYATRSEKSVLESKVNTTARDSVHNYKPGQPTGSIYGFREFKNPLRQAVKKPSVPTFKEKNKQYSFGNIKDYKFKISNIFPSLLPKYSFGQRGGSTTTPPPPPPVNLERIPADYSSPLLGTLIQITTPRPFVSGFKQVQPVMSKNYASMDSYPNRTQFRTYNIKNDLRGSSARPLEGAKPLVREPDKSATLQQDFESLKVRSSQTWQPRSFRIHNHTDETESRSSNTSTASPNELSSEDLKPHLKTMGNSESVTPDENNSRLYTFRTFKSIKNSTAQAGNKMQWQYPMQDPASASYIVSSTYLRSPGHFTFSPRLTSVPRTTNRNKPAAMKAILLNTSTSRSVRARRVKVNHRNSKKLSDSAFSNHTVAIVRMPKHPARVKVVTYIDVLGSASFSGITATSQAPNTSTDNDHFPDVTATNEQPQRVSHWTLNSDDGVHSAKNMNRSSESNTEDEKRDFSSAEKSKEADNELKTDFFLDNEESGSGGFNLSEVLSTGTGSQAFSKDMLELEYLRISTGNVSFMSVNLSHPNTKQ